MLASSTVPSLPVPSRGSLLHTDRQRCSVFYVKNSICFTGPADLAGGLRGSTSWPDVPVVIVRVHLATGAANGQPFLNACFLRQARIRWMSPRLCGQSRGASCKKRRGETAPAGHLPIQQRSMGVDSEQACDFQLTNARHWTPSLVMSIRLARGTPGRCLAASGRLLLFAAPVTWHRQVRQFRGRESAQISVRA